ncbi:hypothetical protein [Neobacillus ginsengisoli]|uniref:DUF7847 domain-containing protein n=1 Tax=Neobacillus ginsengisoli TaxID=904295 RepID=A0ABT9Y0R5_9BACI|nr:hypothetical protein [Neobacillus ginsengisoli]MDQ0201425.1 hypothetical protein [Neobacillus ginsengisoli]
MDSKFKKPKGFGEILDHTFSLSKKRFKDFFMIFLILLGPVYLLEAIIQLVSGTSFFRESGSGGGFEQLLANFNESQTIDSSSLSSDLGLIVTGLLGFLLFPVAEAAILFAINHIRKNEDFTVGLVIKQGFSRFWRMLGSNLFFGVIAFGIMIIPIIIVSFTGVFGSFVNPILGIGLAVVLFLGFAIGIGLLFTRWSFYFALVVLEKDSPTSGIARSWRLTRKRTWLLMGLYIVFYMIISSISFAGQMTFGILLGNSVLLSIITNIISLFTTMFFSVGYGVMYLDLKIRHDADDLKDLIDDYNKTTL